MNENGVFWVDACKLGRQWNTKHK